MRSAGKCSCADNQPAWDALARQAKQCSTNGRNKFKFAIMRAMKSLQAYPLPIASEREAMQLEGVGNYLAHEIMKALRHYNAENVAVPVNGVEEADCDDGAMVFSQTEDVPVELSQSAASTLIAAPAPAPAAAGKSREYTPETGRGPWILLVVLHITGGSGSRPEILEQAAAVEACTLARTTLASSWASSIRTLMSKDLVEKTTGTVYALTESGTAVARSAHEAYQSSVQPAPQDPVSRPSQLGVRRKITAADRSTGESPAFVRQRSETSATSTATASYTMYRTSALLELSDDEEVDSLGAPPTSLFAIHESLSQQSATSAVHLDLTQDSSQEVATAMSMQASFHHRQLTRAATYPAADTHRPVRIPAAPAQAASSTMESTRFVGGSPTDWTIMLLIDHRENDAELIQTSMLGQGFACETVQLSVGDFLWVAQHKTLSNERIVLDIILERKTVNDLACSIIDGRYNEQKLRLKQAAIPTSAYIIEGNLSAQDRLDPGSLRTAMTTTEVVHGLRVIPTRNIDHSIRMIQNLFEQQVRLWPKTFASLSCGSRAPTPFADFQRKFVKKSAQTVGDVFRAQLRQIPNCSATRAAVINRQFDTMRQMLQHFDQLGDRKAAEQSLTRLQSDQRTRPIGPALARFITRLYSDEF